MLAALPLILLYPYALDVTTDTFTKDTFAIDDAAIIIVSMFNGSTTAVKQSTFAVKVDSFSQIQMSGGMYFFYYSII